MTITDKLRGTKENTVRATQEMSGILPIPEDYKNRKLENFGRPQTVTEKIGLPQKAEQFKQDAQLRKRQETRAKYEPFTPTLIDVKRQGDIMAKANELFALEEHRAKSPKQIVQEKTESDYRMDKENLGTTAANILKPINTGMNWFNYYVGGPLTKGFAKGIGDESLYLGIDYNPHAISKGTEVVGSIISPFVMPGSGLGLGNSVINAGRSAAGAASKASPLLGGKVTQRAIEGAGAGAYEGLYASLLAKDNPKEVATNVLLGAGLGSAIDVGLGAVSDHFRKMKQFELEANGVPEYQIEQILEASPYSRKNINELFDKVHNEINNDLRLKNQVDEVGGLKNLPEETVNDLFNKVETSLKLENNLKNVTPQENIIPTERLVSETVSPNNTVIDELDIPIRSADEVVGEIDVPLRQLDNSMDEVLPIRNLPEQEQAFGISPLSKTAKFTDPNDTRTYIRSSLERQPIDAKNVVEKVYTKLVDDIQSINKFDKEVEKLIGRKLEGNERAYYKALNSRGSDMISNHILTDRLVDANGNVIGQSLRSIMSQLPSGKVPYINFNDYLIAKHAKTRMARGEKVYKDSLKMTPQKIDEKIAQYERTYPEFVKVSDELYDFNRRMGQAWLVDTGMIPQNMFNSWIKENPFWVPNKRFFTDLEKRKGMSKGGAKGAFANQNKPVKEYSKEGSQRDIIDPIESLIEYADKYVKTAKRNEVVQTIFNSLKNTKELDNWGRILKKEKIEIKRDFGDVIDDIDNERLFTQWKKGDADKSNVVSFFNNGERIYMELSNPDFIDAIANMDSVGQNAVIEASRKLTNAFKNLTTGINPIFGLTRNIFRDIPEGFIFSNTTNNPFKYAIDVIDGFNSVFADAFNKTINNSRNLQKVLPDSFRRWVDKQGALYRDYKSVGGGHSSPVAADRNLLKQSKNAILPQNSFSNSPIKSTFNKAMSGLENLNNALESGVRLGEFKRSRLAGETMEEALFRAQDITTNFKRKGNIVRDIDAVVPYMNAAVQGLDKLGRQLKDAPAATIAKALSVISAPTIALYALNHDNPDYQKLSNYNKDNFYMIPNGDGTFTKIAKPRETGVIFSALLERTLRAWKEDDPDAFKGFADTARTMFAPPVIGDIIEGKNPIRSTIAGPLYEVGANENFMGSPIVPRYLEKGSPRYQYDVNTSEIGKFIGDILNVSPKKVDHLIKGYTGVIGQVAMPATTNVGGTGNFINDAVSNIGETLEKQVVVDPRLSTDAMNNFYELYDDLMTEYDDIISENVDIPDDYDTIYLDTLKSIKGEIDDYTKAIRELDKSKEFSKEEKKEYKIQLTSERNDLARAAYEAVRDAMRAGQ